MKSSVADDSSSGGISNPTITATTDWIGRTVQYQDALGVMTTTTYDAAGRVASGQTGASLSQPVITTSYNSEGRVDRVKSGTTVMAVPLYDMRSGVMTSVKYPNGTSGEFTSDSRGRAQSVEWRKNAAATNGVQLRAQHDGKCLDIEGPSTADGAAAQQWSCIGANQTNQLFNLIPLDSTWFEIRIKMSGKCIDVDKFAAMNDGAKVQQWTCNSAIQQQWKLVPTGTGYNLVSRLSGKCIDVAGVSTADGQDTQLYSCLGASQTNQIFKVVDPNTGADVSLGSSTLLTSNSVTRKPSGRISDQAIDGTDVSGAGDGFTYDAVGRLTGFVTVGSSGTYNYAGAQASTCSQGALASGKNSNITSQTVGGVTTASCYDQADRLVSTNASGLSGTISYDSHGNVSAMAGETMTYDMADRHMGTSKGTSGSVSYVRDAADRIIQRSEGGVVVARYAYSGGGDSPSLVLNPAGTAVVERTLGLPGGVSVTFRSGPTVLSYPTLHGDVAATADTAGVKQGATVVYDPFGNVASGALPDNAVGNMDYGWHGQQQRPLEHAAGLVAVIEMGARQYLPQVGRFLEVDPVTGGTPNDYVYPTDPVNGSDLNGLFWGELWNGVKKAAKKTWKVAVEHRTLLAGLAAGGVCAITAGVGCVIATAGALAVRMQKRAADHGGWRKTMGANIADAALTTVTFGVGQAFGQVGKPYYEEFGSMGGVVRYSSKAFVGAPGYGSSAGCFAANHSSTNTTENTWC